MDFNLHELLFVLVKHVFFNEFQKLSEIFEDVGMSFLAMLVEGSEETLGLGLERLLGLLELGIHGIIFCKILLCLKM
jgi:hypothetical protein